MPAERDCVPLFTVPLFEEVAPAPFPSDVSVPTENPAFLIADSAATFVSPVKSGTVPEVASILVNATEIV